LTYLQAPRLKDLATRPVVPYDITAIFYL